MRISRIRTINSAPAQWFTGSAWIETISSPGDASGATIASVRFAAGARTVWHRHPAGQMLVVTDGTGFVQRRGGPVETVRAGDSVWTAPDEWHWHGATATTSMTHLAVEAKPDGAQAETGDPVADDEYAGHGGGRNPETDTDTETAPITRMIVLDQAIPQTVTYRVEVRRISIAAGHAAGLHIHNGPVFGSIEAGSVVYQIDGQPESVLSVGDTFYEPEGARVARFDPLEAGVTFLAYFLLGDGQKAEIEFPDLGA